MPYTYAEIGARAKTRAGGKLDAFSDEDVGRRLAQRNPQVAKLVASGKGDEQATAPTATPPDAPEDESKPATEHASGIKSLAKGAWSLLQGAGKIQQDIATKALPSLAKSIAKPFTRTAGTIAAGMQSALGNGPTDEDVANMKGTMFEPYGTKREAIGGALEIGATLLPGTTEAKALMASKAIGNVAKQSIVGGGTGLGYGAGVGFEKSGKEDMGAADTALTVAEDSLKGGAVGAVVGAGTGALTNKWQVGTFSGKQPVRLPSVKARSELMAKAADIDGTAAVADFADDAAGTAVADSAKTTLPKAVAEGKKPPLPKASASAPQPAKVADSAKTLLDNGFDANDLNQLADLDADDLQAINAGIENAKRLSSRPADSANIRLGEGLAKNVMAKVNRLEEMNRPLAARMKELAASANGEVDRRKFADAVLDAMPDDLTAYSDQDRAFLEKVIDRAAEVRTNRQAHLFRQWIARETDALLYSVKGGVPSPGDSVANRVRTGVGGYLDEAIPGYGELRRTEAPILEAQDEFWRAMGGRWKRYDGEALNDRAAQLSQRLVGRANADTKRAFAAIDGVLEAHGESVGGSVSRQQYYVDLIENLFKRTPPGSLKGQMQDAILNAGDLRKAATSTTGKLEAVAKVGRNVVGRMRSAEKAEAEVRQAFEDFVTGLLRSKAK